MGGRRWICRAKGETSIDRYRKSNRLGEEIRAQVDAEFDRVRKVLESVAGKQSLDDETDLQVIIRLLEDKRVEVMGNEQAGYFIHDWQELRDQVRRLIVGDPRYRAIKADQAARVAGGRGENIKQHQASTKLITKLTKPH